MDDTCSRGGEACLCEKPAALNVKEVEKMVAACRKSNVVFMEAYAFRSHPEWHRLKRILDSGHIGEIEECAVRYSISVDKGMIFD